MAVSEFEYAPKWAEGVSDDELLHELSRRNAYLLAGWQESYRSAQYWRERAARLDELIEAVEPFTVDGGVSCGSEEIDALVETYERVVTNGGIGPMSRSGEPQQKDRKVLLELTEDEAKELLAWTEESAVDVDVHLCDKLRSALSEEGHVCDPERPCEPNDHLCKNAPGSEEGDDQGEGRELALALHRLRDEATWLRSHRFEERAKLVEGWVYLEARTSLEPWEEDAARELADRLPAATLPSPSQEDGERFEQAVEAAARAPFDHSGSDEFWDALDPEAKEAARDDARRMLRAALSYLQPAPISLSEQDRERLIRLADLYLPDDAIAFVRKLANKSEDS